LNEHLRPLDGRPWDLNECPLEIEWAPLGPELAPLDDKISAVTRRRELIDKWSASQQYIEDKDDEDNYNDDGYFPPLKSRGIQVKTADPEECDGYDSNDQYGGEDDPSSQLLTEYYASFMNDNQHEDEENSLFLVEDAA